MKRAGFKILCADIILFIFVAAIIGCRLASAGQKNENPGNLLKADAVVWKADKSDGQAAPYAAPEQQAQEQQGQEQQTPEQQGQEQQTPEQQGQEQQTSEQQAQEKKQIAITFDDGPDPVYTPKLLDGLKERNVKATFFLLGKQAEKYPDIVKQMYEAGHAIGCHSYEHVDLSNLSEADACEQIQKICDLIYEITGERPSFVRPPYGEWLPCLDEDFCMIPVLWNVDPLDWATKDARLVTDRVLEDVEEYDIILMHDASASSVEAALQIIDLLQEEGYEFVTVEELLFP